MYVSKQRSMFSANSDAACKASALALATHQTDSCHGRNVYETASDRFLPSVYVLYFTCTYLIGVIASVTTPPHVLTPPRALHPDIQRLQLYPIVASARSGWSHLY